jgi:hypothetical protein
LELPDGAFFADPDGHERGDIRIKWWQSDVHTYREAAQIANEHMGQVPDIPLPKGAMSGFSQEGPMTFIGHYWLEGEPQNLAPNVICVDYSIAKQGKLCAYQVGLVGSRPAWVYRS